MLVLWANEMIGNYSIDGLRIDSVLNVNNQFFHTFNGGTKVFCLGEALSIDARSVCQLQGDGLDGFLNYPLYYTLTKSFNNTETDLTGLIVGKDIIKGSCYDVFSLGTFTENQDVPRFSSFTKDTALKSNVITYKMLGDGIPIGTRIRSGKLINYFLTTSQCTTEKSRALMAGITRRTVSLCGRPSTRPTRLCPAW